MEDHPRQGSWHNWSPYWRIGNAPSHCYQLEQGLNIITLQIPYPTKESWICNSTYLETHTVAQQHGLIGTISIYSGSPHFPEPAEIFIPNETYQVNAYQSCDWCFDTTGEN